MRIERLGPGDDAAVLAAGHLFDGPASAVATADFLTRQGHHLLLAYADDEPAGFITGVETVHPDKGTELFLYELGVDPRYQRRGVGTALVEALLEIARSAGCHSMWVATEATNQAAVATYRRAGAGRPDDQVVVLTWELAQR